VAERGEGNGEQNELGSLDGSEEPSPLGAAEPLMVGREQRPPGSGSGRLTSWRPKRQRSWKWWALVGVVVVALLFAPGFVSGLKKTPKNRIGISYGGGPFESAHFQRIVQPGSGLFFNGFFDPLYLYPSDQQNYIISLTRGVGATQSPDSIVAPTSDKVAVTYQVAVYFTLNTKLLRQFHEQLGLKYAAYTSKGWYNLIRDTFRQQIENALQEETRQISVADIYGNAQQLVGLQNRVQAKISARLQDALGARFFCSPSFVRTGVCGDPTFIIKAVSIPKSVALAFQQQRTSAILVEVKQNELQQAEAEEQSVRALAAAGLSGQDYVLKKAIEAGKINLWVVPQNGSFAITSPTNGSGASVSSGSTTTTTTPKK
jgi:regulator of protease activity HflC (stomatin/prohibitin superfamily)